MFHDDVEATWLASYPKSGNTWLRFFLSGLILGRPPENSRIVEDMISEVGSGINDMAFSKHGDQIFKTHCLYSALCTLNPNTRNIIYIVRNPLDVMLSAFNYHCLHLGTKMGTDEDTYRITYISHYLNDGADMDWLKLQYGTWKNHVDCWTGEETAHLPRLIIRYEDMKANPVLCAHTICAFMAWDKTDQEIHTALEFASFKNMQAMEERELQSKEDTFFTREKVGMGHDQGLRFMNKGKTNRQHLIPPRYLQEAKTLFAPQMRKFGYL